MNCDAKQIVYAVVSIEYMKLMIKLRQYDTLAQLGEKIIKKCQQEFNLPQDASRSGATQIPLPIVYMAVYATRARAELIHMNHIIAEQSDRKELLEKCAFWCESNILLKT